MLASDRRIGLILDWPLVAAALAVPTLGLVVLYSAGFNPEATTRFGDWVPSFIESPTFVRQAIFLMCGIVVMLLASLISPIWLSRLSYAVYGIGCVLLVAVLVAGIVSHGSRRWIALGPFNIQPAEPMKIALMLALARYLSRHPPPPGGYGFTQLIIPALIIGIPMRLIAKQPDLGSALSFGAIGMMMILFLGVRIRILAGIIVVSLAAIYPTWLMLWPYQRRRILTLLNPEADALGSGYHIIQSKIAVGSGALFGKGFLKGTQSQLEFLPEHTTDFVFSVLAEEWGFLGCMLVLAVYWLLLYRMLRVVAKCKDLFGALLVVGVTSLIFFHTITNIGMVVGLLPVVGIPLPLFSYGGSSVLSSMFGIGLVLSISARRMLFINKRRHRRAY